jgi:ABC-type nitrate/sulfonate/bicarbonate transport system ATPase subunit
MKFDIAGKSFGNKKVLGPLALELQDGKSIAIVGASGSGKTTLLRIIAGLDQDSAGTKQPRCRMGFVFQEPRLLPWKSVLQNVEIGGPERGLLAELQLKHAAQLFPYQLSLGMARRVALARALASKPDLLIVDEPFASLDTDTIAIVKNVVKGERRNFSKGVIFTAHDTSNLLIGESEVIELARGRLR